MKMNAFERIICMLACGGVVLSASPTIGQINDSSVTYGALQLVDQNGSEFAPASPVQQNLGAPMAQPLITPGSAEARSRRYAVPQQHVVPQQYAVPGQYGVPTYPLPGMSQGEIPLPEFEVPGSAYFVGPKGERIEPSQTMRGPVGITSGGKVEMPGPSPTYSVEPFSVERVYDGTLSFPMGTFPTTPFGERIISEVPFDKTAADAITQKAPVAGKASVEGRGDKTSSYEFLKPDDSIAGSLSDSSTKPENSSGNADMKKEDGSMTADEVIKGGDDNLDQIGRQARLKQRLRDALANKDRLDALLRNANKKNQTAMAEIDKLKSSLVEVKDSLEKKTAQSRKTTAEAAANLEALQFKQSKMSKQLKSLAKTLQKQRQSARSAIATAHANEAEIKSQNQELFKEIELLTAAKTKAMEQVEEAQRQIANLNKDLSKQREATKAAVASAEVYNEKVKMLTEKMAAQSKASQITSAGEVGRVAGSDVHRTTETKSGADGDRNSPKPNAKEIAELEVKRELEERRKKQLEKQASQLMEKSKDKDASEDANEKDKLTLEQQIATLKKKRDSQIAALETRIRAKYQKSIDELIESGKTVNSDEVKDAVGAMRNSIKTSEEKLRSRFSRKLDRLKKEFENQEK